MNVRLAVEATGCVLLAAEYNLAFYSVVAQVFPVLIGLLFFESRLLKPRTPIHAFRFFVPLGIMAIAEANALGIIYSHEPPEDIQRNIVLSGLILGIGSLVLTPIVRLVIDWAPEDQARRNTFFRAASFWTFVLVAVAFVLVFTLGKPLVTLSWIGMTLLLLSAAASHSARGQASSPEDEPPPPQA